MKFARFPLFRLLLALWAVCSSACSRPEAVQSGCVGVSDGGYLYYEASGSGEPLLLLHGHSLDRRMWEPQTAPFAEHFRVIRPDFRGYGRSSKQSEELPFTHLGDILALMDSLHIDRAHIVGLSMGAFVAGDMLALAPERMRSCVLASGGIRSTPGPHEPMDSLEAARRDREIAELKAKGVETMKREWLETLVGGGGSRREQLREPLRTMIADWDAWQPLHKEVRMFWAREAWAQLEQRRPAVPLLMLKGETELNGKPYAPRELDFVPGGRAVVLPDCGHMMNLEQPEAFNAVVLEFLLDAAGR